MPGLLATAPNWAEKVTAIATAVGAVGLLGTIVAAIFAVQQVREARHSGQAGMVADFLRIAFEKFVETNSMNAYILYREQRMLVALGD